MQKLILILAIGILTFSLGGCGSTEEAEETETIEETTPNETEGSEEQNDDDGDEDDDDDEQSQLEEFKDPLVEERQKDQAAADAGLIQSTKAEERLLQLKGSSNGTPVAAAPTGTPADPFSVLPPLVVQETAEDEPATDSIRLNARQVPELPALPVAAAPPAFRSPSDLIAVQPGGNGTTSPQQRGNGTTSPQQQGNGTASPQQRGNGNGTTSPQQRGNGTTSPSDQSQTVATALPPAQIPSLPQLPVPPTPAEVPAVVPQPPAPPTTPPLEVATIPQLPNLPPSESPVAWVDPNPPVIAEPPPPPSTAIAEAIAVTGVVRSGNQTRVILKAPTEPTSRYVNVGQTIANGEVLVKRVKFSQASDPIVIFEQNGVEVAVEVGSMPLADEDFNNILPPPPSINAFNQV